MKSETYSLKILSKAVCYKSDNMPNNNIFYYVIDYP